MTRHSNYGLSHFFIHFVGALLLVAAITMRLSLLPHLLTMHPHETLRLMIDDTLFFIGTLLLFGRERVRSLFAVAYGALSVFWQECRNVAHALNESSKTLINDAMFTEAPKNQD